MRFFFFLSFFCLFFMCSSSSKVFVIFAYRSALGSVPPPIDVFNVALAAELNDAFGDTYPIVRRHLIWSSRAIAM